jgi:hypothetical protein
MRLALVKLRIAFRHAGNFDEPVDHRLGIVRNFPNLCEDGGRCRHVRRIPPLPRTLARHKITGGYVVRDASGRALAYIYSRENEAEARQARVLTADEASADRRQLRSVA